MKVKRLKEVLSHIDDDFEILYMDNATDKIASITNILIRFDSFSSKEEKERKCYMLVNFDEN